MNEVEVSRYTEDVASNVGAKKDNKRQGLWIHTYKGHQFYAFDPREDDIDIDDIAHALALTCRYSGHCNKFFSVAQHSVLVSFLVPEEQALAALLHDAPEAYLTDIPRPIKHMLNEYGVPFSDVEDRIYKVIAKKYGCQYPLPNEVHEIDHHIVADEAEILFDPVPEWTQWYRKTGAHIVPVGPEQAEAMFKMRFEELTHGTEQKS